MAKIQDKKVPTKCPACTSCWLNPDYNRCDFGGPFLGYSNQAGDVLDREGNVIGSVKNLPKTFYHEGSFG
jgi:hypothetical protein